MPRTDRCPLVRIGGLWSPVFDIAATGGADHNG
jgi:hypothetical protein